MDNYGMEITSKGNGELVTIIPGGQKKGKEENEY